MRVSEHEAEVSRLTEMMDRIKSQLASADREVGKLYNERDEWKQIATDLGAIVEATKDDALLWRAARLKRRGNK